MFPMPKCDFAVRIVKRLRHVENGEERAIHGYVVVPACDQEHAEFMAAVMLPHMPRDSSAGHWVDDVDGEEGWEYVPCSFHVVHGSGVQAKEVERAA